jgi:hypothetical protein
MRVLIAVVCLSLALAARLTAAPDIESPHAVTLRAGDIEAVFADNEEFPGHRAWYNGLHQLRHKADTLGLFWPGVAGLNFEHIYDGQKWWEPAEALFEPRSSPMTITRLAGDTVLLHQPPTRLHKLESWTRFTLSAPHYVDMDFRCIAREATFDRGYIGLFWASYINTHVSREYYFIGRKPGESKNRWLAYLSPEHNEKSTVDFIEESRRPSYTPEHPPRLFMDCFQYGYSYPFYYGRRGDMVIILMFDQAGPIRFSHSPSSGGPVSPSSNPAWDFQYLIYDCQVGAEYGFRARLVYKPFTDETDIIREYETFSGVKVRLD